MGYDANGNGFLKFKTQPPEEIFEEILKEFEYSAPSARADGERKDEIYVWSYDRYHEDAVLDILDKISPFISRGEIDYAGQDDEYWRFIFDGEKFVEENGSIVYESERDSHALDLQGSRRLEFLGSIIEVFEDFLDDRCIVLDNDEKKESDSASNIYGTDYGDLESELETLLQRSGVLTPPKP